MRPKVICFLFSAFVAVSLVAAQTQSPRLESGGIRYADQFQGSTVSDKINAAMADCGAYTGAPGNSCLVIIPSTMGCGEPHQAPDNVLLWDLRGCAQSQGLRFNVPRAASGRVRSKILLQDNFTVRESTTPPPVSSATLYVHSLADSPNQTTGSIAAINGTASINSLTGDFKGNLIGIEGEAFAILTRGGPFVVNDIRAGTFNTTVGRDITATNVTSLYAQAPAKAAGGTITNAYSFRAEAPIVGTKSNLAGWFNGDVKVDTRLAVGGTLSIGGGSPINRIETTSSLLNFEVEIPPQGCVEKPINNVPSAGPKSTVSASPSATLGNVNLSWSAWVSSPGTISVRVCNVSPHPILPKSVVWNANMVQ